MPPTYYSSLPWLAIGGAQFGATVAPNVGTCDTDGVRLEDGKCVASAAPLASSLQSLLNSDTSTCMRQAVGAAAAAQPDEAIGTFTAELIRCIPSVPVQEVMSTSASCMQEARAAAAAAPGQKFRVYADTFRQCMQPDLTPSDIPDEPPSTDDTA
jgi:hypothetical protein